MRITYIDDLSSGIDRFLPLLNKRSVLYAQLIGILVRIRRRPETFGKRSLIYGWLKTLRVSLSEAHAVRLRTPSVFGDGRRCFSSPLRVRSLEMIQAVPV